MPRLPSAVAPDVRAAPSAPFDYQEVRATPASFGGAPAEALQRAGAQGVGASGEVIQAATQQQEFHNEIAGTQAMNTFQKGLLDVASRYNATTGHDAMYGYQGAQDQVNQLRNQIRGGLQNDAQRHYFDQAATRYQYFTLERMGSHYDEQQKSYAAGQNAEAMDLQDRHVAQYWNDDTAFFNAAADNAHAAVNRAKAAYGQTADPTILKGAIADATSRLVLSRAQAWAASDPAGALNWVQTGTMPDPLGNNAPGQPPKMVPVKSQLSGQQQLALTRELGDAAIPVQAQALGRSLMGAAAQPGAQSGAGGTAQAPTGAPNTDTLAAAIVGQEQSGPTAVSVAGAAGRYQITPATFQHFAKPGESFNNEADRAMASLRAITQYQQQYGNDPARVAVAWFSGPGNVAPPGSPTPWKQDLKDADGQTTSGYVAGVEQRLPGATGTPAQFPDESKVVQRALALTAGNQKLQDATLRYISRSFAQMHMATATDRSDLQHQYSDLQAAALHGLQITIPEDRIRAAFPPDDADRMITGLEVAKTAGSIISGIQWDTPAQVDGVVSDLTSGMGSLSGMLRQRLAGTKGAATVTTPEGPGQASPVIESPEAYALRQRVAAMALGQIQERAKALAADPGAYVLSAPTVAAAAAAAQADPTKLPDYARASLAVQDHLGVPAASQHVLSLVQAQSAASKLTAPGADAQGQMRSLQQQWGDAWPHVFADLVTLGKLPAAYQSVAALDNPRDASLLARAINETSKGGKDWDEILGTAGARPVAATLRNSIQNDPTVMQMQHALSASGASAQQIAGITGSIFTLAYAKRFYDGDANAAADAVQSFAGKYTFLPNGGAMVPTAVLDNVTQNAASTLAALNPTALAIPHEFGSGPAAPSVEDYILSLRSNPTWVTSPRGDAIWLEDAGGRIVRGRDGKPIAVPFNAGAPAGPTGSATTSDQADETRLELLH